MTTDWKHQKTIVDGENYSINGANIWDFEWTNTGEKINIVDPLYGQKYCFNVYKIHVKNTDVYFAAYFLKNHRISH